MTDEQIRDINEKISAWFESGRVVADSNGCWVWRGARDRQGYGFVKVSGFQWRAHRLAYHLQVGPIPDGFTIDHLCRNASCIRPEHLEAVTNKTNVLRGIGISAENARKTHCKRGHLLSPENLIKHSRQRVCKTCHLQGQKDRRERERHQRAN